MIKDYTLVLTVHNVKQMIEDQCPKPHTYHTDVANLYRRNIKDHCAECDQDPYAMRTDPDGQLITVAGEPTGIYRRDNDQTFHEEAVRYFEFVLGDK